MRGDKDTLFYDTILWNQDNLLCPFTIVSFHVVNENTQTMVSAAINCIFPFKKKTFKLCLGFIQLLFLAPYMEKPSMIDINFKFSKRMSCTVISPKQTQNSLHVFCINSN